jgi:hypothetical protein
VRRAFEDLATGQYTKQEVIARATEAGLRSRKGLRLSPQSFGQMMLNPICVGQIESPDYGVSTRGDFEPLVDEATFYRRPGCARRPYRGGGSTSAASSGFPSARVRALRDVRFSPKESRTTQVDSIEPPQRRHISTTWRRIRALKKVW